MSRKPDRHPRWLNRMYALTHGYFWMPCPLCGRPFGGHEVRSLDSVVTGPNSGQAICPPCSDALAGQHQQVCDSQGCEITEIWHGVTTHEQGGEIIKISIDTDREPDVRCCRYCRRPPEAAS